jgi:hypothetical protein
LLRYPEVLLRFGLWLLSIQPRQGYLILLVVLEEELLIAYHLR